MSGGPSTSEALPIPGARYVRDAVVDAIVRLYFHDRSLIKDNVYEPAISHRLAYYLEPHFPGWHIDCEYDKQANSDDERHLKTVGGPTAIRPDINIHRRREKENLLVIELKKDPPSGVGAARKKAKGYVTAPELEYHQALFLVLGNSGCARAEVFKNGGPTDSWLESVQEALREMGLL